MTDTLLSVKNLTLNIPTGMPLHYRLDADMAPVEAKHPLERALDPEAAAAGAAEVAAQAAAKPA